MEQGVNYKLVGHGCESRGKHRKVSLVAWVMQLVGDVRQDP